MYLSAMPYINQEFNKCSTDYYTRLYVEVEFCEVR